MGRKILFKFEDKFKEKALYLYIDVTIGDHYYTTLLPDLVPVRHQLREMPLLALEARLAKWY